MRKKQVGIFLSELKNIALASGITLIPREKTIKGLISLGISKKMAMREILNLTHKEYVSGPEKDESHIHKGDIWVFGNEINGRQAYIKLKIDEINEEKVVKCLAFHPAEYELKFPII